jgi:tetratricopeptide (TPR) repeat protein
MSEITSSPLSSAVASAVASDDAEPQVVSSNPEGMFYTPSMMLTTMNDSLSATGGSCTLKRKLEDGSLIESTQAERDAADCSAKMRQSAEQIANLTQDEKALWAADRRKHGNDLFTSGEFQKAMDVYMTCLCGMAPPTAPKDDVLKSDEIIALPAMLNMAACAYQLGNYAKCVTLCDQAHTLSCGPASYKLRLRRGRARLRRGDLDEARDDFRGAMSLANGDEAPEKEVRRELAKLKELREKAKENKEGVRKAMEKAMKMGEETGGEGFYEGEKGDDKIRRGGLGRRKATNFNSEKSAKDNESSKQKMQEPQLPAIIKLGALVVVLAYLAWAYVTKP